MRHGTQCAAGSRESPWAVWLPASAVVLLGLSVMIGWAIRSPAMIRVVPGTVAMVFNTALQFCLLGVALLVQTGSRSGKRLVQTIAGFVIVLSSFGDFRVTLSAGVATLAPGQDAEMMLDAADRALYRAKQLGRNRVEVPSAAAVSSIPAPAKPGDGLPFRRPSSTRMRRVRGPG